MGGGHGTLASAPTGRLAHLHQEPSSPVATQIRAGAAGDAKRCRLALRRRPPAGPAPSRRRAPRGRSNTACRAATRRRRSGTSGCRARRWASSRPPAGRPARGRRAHRRHGAGRPERRRRRRDGGAAAGTATGAAMAASVGPVTRRARGARRRPAAAADRRGPRVQRQAGAPCPPPRSWKRPAGGRSRRWNGPRPRAPQPVDDVVRPIHAWCPSTSLTATYGIRADSSALAVAPQNVVGNRVRPCG